MSYQQVCLKQAIKEELYSKAIALAFLLDRYMYWSGKGEYLHELIGLIRTKCPEGRVAPQLLIRKARLLKDQGAVQEADELLKYLIENFECE